MACKGRVIRPRLIQSAKLEKLGRVPRVPCVTDERWIMQSLRETLRDLEEISSRSGAPNYPSISISFCEGVEGMQPLPNVSSSTLSDEKSEDSNSNFLTVPILSFNPSFDPAKKI